MTKEKKVQIAFLVEKDQKRALMKMARKQGRSVSSMMRYIFLSALPKEEKEDAETAVC